MGDLRDLIRDFRLFAKDAIERIAKIERLLREIRDAIKERQ